VKVAIEFVTIPKDGEKVNGDAALVRRDAGPGGPGGSGVTLVAVIDALGHGEKAAQAADVGMRYLEAAPLGKGIRHLMEGLHDQLRGTRGAAAMLLLLERDKLLTGCSVGNVTLRSYRAKVPATLTPGVLGGQMNKLRLFQAELAPGDRLVVFSDGISSRFDEEAARRPEAFNALATCQAIMAHHRKAHDDATVLVVDVESVSEGVGRVGGSPPNVPPRAP
jgi:negative regulator of sigma-B (phosphoserine phosphatase)